MAAHFTTQRRVDFLHLGFDEGVACLVHQSLAAGSFNGGGKALRALHIKHNGAAGHARKHVLGKQHHLAVGVNIGAVFGDDAQAVAIAIKGQAQLSITGLQSGNQVAQVFGLAGVGVVIGKGAVYRAVQLLHFATNGAQYAGGRGTGNAVARIHHDLDRPRELDVPHDARSVGGQHIYRLPWATALQCPALGLHHTAQGLNFLAINGTPGQHHFETVVVARVVAASDLNATLAQGIGRKVQHGCGDHTYIDHRDASLFQSAHQGRREHGAAQATIAAHSHCGFTLRAGSGAKGTAQAQGHFFGQGGGHNATDIVGFENTG